MKIILIISFLLNLCPLLAMRTETEAYQNYTIIKSIVKPIVKLNDLYLGGRYGIGQTKYTQLMLEAIAENDEETIYELTERLDIANKINFNLAKEYAQAIDRRKCLSILNNF